MKNAKIIFLLVFLVTGATINAQVSSICYPSTNNYIVDATDTEEPTTDGTYTWTLTNSDGDDFSSLITVDSTDPNKISIDWENSGLPKGDYTIEVIEKLGNCDGEPRKLIVTLGDGYLAPAITTPASPVCIGATNNNEFLLTGGTAGAVVGYTITSNNAEFTDIISTVTLDGNGDASIPYPGLTDDKTSETFTLTLTSIDDVLDPNDPNADACNALNLTDDNITESVIINSQPVTSPITPVTPTP